MTARLLDEAVDLAQPEAGALPWLLGGEERIERLRLHLARHAGAGVAHRYLDIVSDRDIGIVLRVALVDEGAAGLDRQLALAVRDGVAHGILGVDHEVENRCLHLARVDLNLPKSGTVDNFEIDVLANRAPEELRHSADQLIDVDRAGIERLAPCKCKQPLRQRGRPLRAARGIGDGARHAVA